MPLSRFDTPGGLRDAPTGSLFYEKWHAFIDGALGVGTTGTGGVGGIYNPAREDVTIVACRAIVWGAFPRRIRVVQNRDDLNAALRHADARTLGDRAGQEEYCEWRATRTGGKIDKVIFTTEVPEYWKELFNAEPDVVVCLYRAMTGHPEITKDDLVLNGRWERDNPEQYDKHNMWNTEKGIVHLNVESLQNTLGAALGLLTASGRFGSNGVPFSDNYELQANSFQEQTSADPRVSIDCNTLIRRNLVISARNPVGLSIAGWDDAGWTKPDGSPVGNYWKIVRGSPGAALRVEYEVPASEGFLVGDIRIGGRPIEYGGQIADHITVQAIGIAGMRTTPPPPPPLDR